MAIVVDGQRERIEEGEALGIPVEELDLEVRCAIPVFECDVCGKPITDSAEASITAFGVKEGKVVPGPFVYHPGACAKSFRAEGTGSEEGLDVALIYTLLRTKINLWDAVTRTLARDEVNSGWSDIPEKEEDVPEEDIRRVLRLFGIHANPCTSEEVEAEWEEIRKMRAADKEQWGSKARAEAD
jgi:hypothetical protein